MIALKYFNNFKKTKSFQLLQRRVLNTAVLCLGIGGNFSLCATADPIAPPPIPTTTSPANPNGEQITLALENADIKELIRWAAEHINKNIILHPDVKGQVTVISGSPLTRDQAYEVFLSTLQAYGYAVVESNGVLQVVPTEVANQTSVPVLEKGKTHSGEDVVVQIVKTNNIAATQLANLLKPMLPASALLTPYSDSNLLLISARANQIERLRAIIARLDQGGGTDIDMLTLDFARAKDVVQIINTLLNKGGTQASSGAGNFTLTVDERSNSVLMSGDSIVRQQVRSLIERLDKPKSGEGNTQVLFVRFAAAETLAPILQGVSSSFLKGDKDQASANIDTKIEVSKENNALIITAAPALQEVLRGVIRQLDVRRPQVIVEAIIVEVNDDILNNIGVQWNSGVPGSNGVFAGASTFADGTSTPTPPGLGAGLTLGFYHSGDLRGLIRALKSNTSANLLSTPTIVALDNEAAQILVGSNVPFITGQSTSAASSTTTPFQTIERKDIGVTLKVKPRINDDSSITMEVDQTVESIAPSNSKAADIVTNKRNVTTRVLIENDQVLVLGGLLQNDITDQQSKVPLLGDLPIIGRAFRSTNTEVTKKNLMVFIHPRILATADDARALSSDRYQNIRGKQQRLNQNLDRIFIPESAPLLPAIDNTATPKAPVPAASASPATPMAETTNTAAASVVPTSATAPAVQ
ncbi:MAG: type secretion system protein GspD [Verrucomicrobiaceae bacterium]|nr:type secretion system protein GspD [Verrucomicrobiaceae bacterium]